MQIYYQTQNEREKVKFSKRVSEMKNKREEYKKIEFWRDEEKRPTKLININGERLALSGDFSLWSISLTLPFPFPAPR